MGDKRLSQTCLTRQRDTLFFLSHKNRPNKFTMSSCDHRSNKQLKDLVEKLELALKGWEDAIIFSERLRRNLLSGSISTEELSDHFANIASDEERQHIFGDMPNKFNEENQYEDHWLQKNKAMREALNSFENPPTKKQKKDDAK